MQSEAIPFETREARALLIRRVLDIIETTTHHWHESFPSGRDDREKEKEWAK